MISKGWDDRRLIWFRKARNPLFQPKKAKNKSPSTGSSWSRDLAGTIRKLQISVGLSRQPTSGQATALPHAIQK
jgi:hypothetical protein